MSFIVKTSKEKNLSFDNCFENCVLEYYLKRIENKDDYKSSYDYEKFFRISNAIYKQFHNINEIKEEDKNKNVFFFKLYNAY